MGTWIIYIYNCIYIATLLLINLHVCIISYNELATHCPKINIIAPFNRKDLTHLSKNVPPMIE